jgi:hypothetical protein
MEDVVLRLVERLAILMAHLVVRVAHQLGMLLFQMNISEFFKMCG